MIPGDGIGPEISNSVQTIFKAAGIPITWDVQNVTPEKGVTQEVIDSLRRTKIGLKGPLGTPIGKGHRSLNLALRQEFGLYANLRPAVSVPGVKTAFDNVDVVVIRENTEGEYSGVESASQIARFYFRVGHICNFAFAPFRHVGSWCGSEYQNHHRARLS